MAGAGVKVEVGSRGQRRCRDLLCWLVMWVDSFAVETAEHVVAAAFAAVVKTVFHR